MAALLRFYAKKEIDLDQTIIHHQMESILRIGGGKEIFLYFFAGPDRF